MIVTKSFTRQVANVVESIKTSTVITPDNIVDKVSEQLPARSKAIIMRALLRAGYRVTGGIQNKIGGPLP